MTRAPLRLGAALVALYVAVAVATSSWAPGRLWPLFDGFASHDGGQYNWVKPPKEFAERNRLPDPAQARIAFGAGGSSPATAETPDGQVSASLPAGALPPHATDPAARLEVRPFDSTTLGALPPGLRPESNAYQVTITFLPSEASASALATPGTAGVTAVAPADTLLFSVDGRTWTPLQATPLNRANALTAPLTQTGYFLAASRNPPREATSSGGGAPVALFVVAVAVPLVLGYLLLGRRRQREKAAAAAAATKKGRAKSKEKSNAKPQAKPQAKAKAKRR